MSVSTTTISSREFNQDAGGAKKAAERGPVVDPSATVDGLRMSCSVL